MRQRVTVFIIDKGKVLLLYRFKNGKEYYAVPGGGVACISLNFGKIVKKPVIESDPHALQ